MSPATRNRSPNYQPAGGSRTGIDSTMCFSGFLLSGDRQFLRDLHYMVYVDGFQFHRRLYSLYLLLGIPIRIQIGTGSLSLSLSACVCVCLLFSVLSRPSNVTLLSSQSRTVTRCSTASVASPVLAVRVTCYLDSRSFDLTSPDSYQTNIRQTHHSSPIIPWTETAFTIPIISAALK